MFTSDAGDERTATSGFGRMEYGDWAVAGGHNGAVRKADPYSLILCEKLIADGPIVRFGSRERQFVLCARSGDLRTTGGWLRPVGP
jgi:hypothetical protein